MDILKLLRFRFPPREGKTTGQRIRPGLLTLGVVMLLAACGAQATTPKAILDAYSEAIAARDAEAALAVFADDARVANPQRVFNGKWEIRNWIDGEIGFFEQAGGECSEWSNVEETAETIEFDERCTSSEGVWDGHHAYVFEGGKIKEWTMTFELVE